METGCSDEEDITNTKPTVAKVHRPEISQEDQHGKVDEVFSRLNLKHHCKDKLTTADFLKILPSIKKHGEITEKDVAQTFLQKLLMLDHRGRYIPVAVDSTKDMHSATTEVTDDVDTDDSDCDFLFSSSVDNNQSLKQSHVHPMDVQMAVFHCSDSFLRQNMITKLSQCQYALPFLVPDPFTGNIECPLWTFRQLRKSWKVTDKTGATTSKNMPICEAKTPMVSFFRLGSDISVRGDGTLSSSKSQLMNTIISDRHSTFFHRNCPGATKSHCLIDGMADIAWYCPAGKPNDAFSDCVAFCNLHGDAVLHEKQREILINKASVNVVLVPTLGEGDKGRTILSHLVKRSKHLICLLADDDCATVVSKNKRNYKMGLKGRSQSAVATELKTILKELLSTPHEPFQLDTMASVSEIRTDEAEPACQRGKAAAVQIMALLEGKELSEIKDIFLPCHGKMWHEWCKLNKDQYHLQGDEKEKDKTEKEKGMEQKRSEQRGNSSSELMKLFIKNLQSLKGDEKCYFLKWIGILLDTFSTDDLHKINQKYDAKWSEALALQREKCNNLELEKELEKIAKELLSATVGFEHILREMGQMYEAHVSQKEAVNSEYLKYPMLAAELMITGHPMELMDGDAAHVPLTWITSVLDEVIKTLGDKKVFVLSVLGIQSSGKSTMLNAMFGLQFAVSAGRCTRGAFMQLVKVSEEKQDIFQFDYVLVVDTEGLRALELAGENTIKRDNELATFVIGLGNMTLINIFGENTAEMQDILHIAVQAFMRMKKIKKKPNCMFVHQNVTDVEAGDKNKEGKRRLQEDLNKMTKLAAKEEVFNAEFFSDIIEFDVETDVKYFAQLWEGSPPMAPTNPGYSESIQELKDTILSKAKKSPGILMSEFKSTIQDLWNALLTENFVFSFKNTREISVYRTLEEVYGNWTFDLRQAMLTTETNIRIGPVLNIDSIQNELVNGMNKTHEEVVENMKKHFDAVKDKDILVQWRGQFETRIKNFHDDLVKGSKRKLEEIIQQKNARKKLDDKKTVHEKKLLDKSKECASRLKGKLKEEKELKNEFDALWKDWAEEFEADNLPIKDINMQQDVDSILQEMRIVGAHERRSCGNYKMLSNRTDYSCYVTPKGTKGMINKGLHHFGISEDLLPHEKAKTFIDNVVHQSVILIESKPVRSSGYNNSYLHEVAKTVTNQFNEFDSNKHYALKPEFKVDLLLHVFQAAEKSLSESHREFKINNDPHTYLENKKEGYYKVFRSYCEGHSSATVLGEQLCSELKDSAIQYAYGQTAVSLTEEIKGKLHFSRVLLERDVLQSLAERGDFDSYMNYIRDPRTHLKTFIREEVKKCITEPTVRKYMSQHVDKVWPLHDNVNDATLKVKKSKGDINMWLKEFSSLLKVSLDTDCYKHFNDIKDFDFLRDEIQKGLASMKEGFKSLPINMVNLRERQERIFIDQLCGGCWEKCPFCKSVCTISEENHSGDHEVPFHRSPGITGFSIRGEPKLTITICTTRVAGDDCFHPDSSDKLVKYKEYRTAGPRYASWSITANRSNSLYWRWFVCEFQGKLENYHQKRFVEKNAIPSDWRKITRLEAIDSLNRI